MPDYADTLQFLYSLQRFGIKLGLENTESLLEFLGNPHRHYQSIHLAGTNGKGSTAAMLASVLAAAGLRTGLYTSPHLIDFSERIRVDGRPISTDSIVRITRMLRPKINALRSTFFETTTALAFRYFYEQGVEVAVVESGLGGRLDATNVLRPVLSLITSIGRDHVEHLGHNLKSIAREKGGIIKNDSLCVVGRTPKDVLEVLWEIAANKRSTLVRTSSVAHTRIRENSLTNLSGDFTVLGELYSRLRIGLLGYHQLENAERALVGLELLNRLPQYPFARRFTKKVVRAGLRDVVQRTGLRGRLDILRRRSMIVIDVAHNAEAIRALRLALRQYGLRRLIVVFGVMKDKDWPRMLRELRPSVKLLVAVRALTERSLASSDIVRECSRIGIYAVDGQDVANGISTALRDARDSDTVLIVGSHYVAGEALAVLEPGKERLDKRIEN